jgi:flagellar M-ring protein FliF
MDQLKKLLLSLTPRQLASILIVAITVVGGVVAFSRWERDASLRPLFTGLAPQDASAIVEKLRESGVDYKIANNGTELLAPEDKVPELRLQMAGAGLPKAGPVGFEIFDKTNFGITDFAEHVNYQRALEGELERSVMAISDVQQARVHVSLPKDSVFTDDREPAKASVLVGLRPGARLSSANVIAITNLVSSAVEGLTPDKVSVIDMNGNLLSRPHPNGLQDPEQASEASLEYQQAVEHDLAAKINNTLEPLLGEDRFRTGVSADIDMTSGEQSEETYDPSKSVMVSSQKSEDTSGTTRASNPPPGTQANLPPQQAVLSNQAQPQQAAATQPAQAGQAAQANNTQKQTAQQYLPPRGGNTSSTTRRSESINYATSRVTKHLKLPQGTIKRLSIAVLVDQGYKMEGKGASAHRVELPVDTQKLKAIQTLVATLVGLDPMRGDQLTVEALPFDNSVQMDLQAPGAPAQKTPDQVLSLDTLKKKPALLWGSVGGAVLLIGLIAFAVTKMLGGKKRRGGAEIQEALPVAGAYNGLPGGPGANAAAAMNPPSHLPALLPSRTEVLLNQLQENSRNNPEAWANILRGWLSEEEPT